MMVKNLLESHLGEYHTISGDDSVAKGLNQMSAYGTAALIVMDGDLPKGIFTERDFVRCHILFPNKGADDVLIKDVMTTQLVVAEPTDRVEDAMGMMIKAGIRHLPVVGEKKIIGLIGLEDLVKVHVGALTQELHYLKDYISDLQDAAND
ncbi:MAG: CBS domain-containing protein [Desulfobacterales bacterium]|nr:MAG: CBS domain-containing protein [Desulfobacterales bacterium]